jgi:hypothetical protein
MAKNMTVVMTNVIASLVSGFMLHRRNGLQARTN